MSFLEFVDQHILFSGFVVGAVVLTVIVSVSEIALAWGRRKS